MRSSIVADMERKLKELKKKNLKPIRPEYWNDYHGFSYESTGENRLIDNPRQKVFEITKGA